MRYSVNVPTNIAKIAAIATQNAKMLMSSMLAYQYEDDSVRSLTLHGHLVESQPEQVLRDEDCIIFRPFGRVHISESATSCTDCKHQTATPFSSAIFSVKDHNALFNLTLPSID